MSKGTSEEAKVQDSQTQRMVAVPAASPCDALSIQISTTGQSAHPAAVFTTTHATPVHNSNVGSTGPCLVNVVPQVAGSSVLVVTKVPTSGLCTTGQPLHFTRPSSAPAISGKPPTAGRTLVMAVPRATVPQPLAPRPTQTSSTQLPTNLQIPPGMVLIRSDSGQLMLVSQQTLAHAQVNGVPTPRLQASRFPAPIVTVAPAKNVDKLMMIRVVAPPSSPAAVAGTLKAPVPNGQAPKPVVVKPLSTGIAPGPLPWPQAPIKPPASKNEKTIPITKETLDNVKKCKNFLVTLIKLASSGSQSAGMAANVKGLVHCLLDGSLEPEEFTNKLYDQLKATPQPYLVPFLKKSLPAVRYLTTDPQRFIQQAGQPKPQPSKTPLAPPSAPTKPAGTLAGGPPTVKHVLLDKCPRGVPLGPAGTGPGSLLRTVPSVSSTAPKGLVVLSGPQRPGSFSFKRPSVPARHTSSYAFKDTSYKDDDDDDVNDVASMAGVNVKEESVRTLADGGEGTAFRYVVQSCRDVPFLSSAALHARILHAGAALGVSEARPEVVTLVSNATQEFLRNLLEKLSLAAEHRKTTLKGDCRHTQVTDVRSQLHFLEEVELLKRRRQEEEQREMLLRLAKRRCNSEDTQHQLLRQRAKEVQQMEQAQLQHREANLAALAAIGPRKKRPLDSTGNVVSVLTGTGKSAVTRVTMRDLVLCMEEDRRMRRSLTLYKALMR